MLVVRFNPQRRRRPPKVPTPQDALPKVEVDPQSNREQLRHCREQEQLQSQYPNRESKYPS
jgi:hypothetical protein